MRAADAGVTPAIRRSLTFANLVAATCLFVVLGGTSVAAPAVESAVRLMTGKQVKDSSLTTRDVKNGSLLSADFKPGQLPAGETGPAGPVGPMGPAGPIGPPGPKGDDGASGLEGPIGARGAEGPAGPAGPPGADGVKGETGAAGKMGPEGPAGPAGPEGPEGPEGPAGPAGPEGPKGATGPPGPPGPSGVLGSSFEYGLAQAPGSLDQWTFVGTPVELVIAGGPTDVFVSSQAALGSSAPGGGVDLSLAICSQHGTDTRLWPLNGGLWGLRIPQHARHVFALSGMVTGIQPGTVKLGLCGHSSSPGSWNNNNYSYTTTLRIK